MTPELKAKIESVFSNLVVDKRDALKAGFELMPRFVTEFLLAQARAKNAAMSVDDVRRRIARFTVDADRKNAFIHELMMKGEAVLIALLEVEPNLARREHIGRITQLDGEEILVPDGIVEQCKELLYGGVWGSAKLVLDNRAARPRITVAEFTPYQLTQPDMDTFRRARDEFTLEEWVDLLITSAGYRPEAFPTFRSKLLLLARLTPLTQPNLNVVELGPRGTGKSYLLRSLSARAYVLSGAKATAPVLLYNLNTKRLGILGTKKVVIFDEVTHTSFPDRALIAAMKDFMESGNIGRAGRSFVADSSLVFTGNIDLDGEGRLPSRQYRHLFEALPDALCDLAIGDRIHAFIPGWEMPKISDQVLADGVGLLSDYFGEVLGELRRDQTFLDFLQRSKRVLDATVRDQTAVMRMAAGLLRMIYPNGRIGDEGLTQVLQVATELRQRVHRQLERMSPGEFKPKLIQVEGIEPATPAPDLHTRDHLDEQDILANETAQVGKITILLVGGKGGGGVGFVECVHRPGSGMPSVTGLHGPELRHSVHAAYEALLHVGPELGVSVADLQAKRFGVHLVNIAEAKEGPSAGLAIALAMLSAATGRPVRQRVAVTGELSAHGNVNPVGGVAEKLSAARRQGRKLVVVPAENAAELGRLGELVGSLEIQPVRTLREAVKLVFVQPQAEVLPQ
ncbi:MAG TPA: BREX system Lon protease-like protein BrxL [Polyangiaceae bacterium]|nr:BREX system Lon protease-like protein BrxL [Polyangiaceae bacterium]